MPQGFRTKYNTAVGDSIEQDPTSALATLLGIDDATGPVNVDKPFGSPSLELANLRGERETELQNRTLMGTDRQAPKLLDFLRGQMAADPDTGVTARKKAETDRNAYTSAVVLNEPTNPLAQERNHQENFLLAKAQAEHPSQFGAAGLRPGEIDENLVNRLLNYDIPLPSGNVMAREPWASAIREAARRGGETGWNAGEYQNRQKVVQDFKSGASSKRVRALNQGIGHLNDVSGAIAGLGNHEGIAGRGVDWLRQTLSSGSSPEITAFETPRGYLAEEAGTLFHGNPSEAASRIGMNMFSKTAAPSVNRQAVGSLGHLLMTASEELESQLRAGLGIPANAPLPQQFQELLYHPERMDQLRAMIQAAPSEQASQLPAGVTVRRVQ